MGNGRDKGGKDGIGPDDIRLWRAFTRDIEPLEDRIWEEIDLAIEEAMAAIPATTPLPKNSERAQTTAPTAQGEKQPPQLDGKTDLRLKRGRIPIEGRLDLHGYNQEQAHGMLIDFIMSAYAREKRCLLVITGKGGGRFAGLFGDGGRGGVLKQRLPQWLDDAPLRNVILKCVQAAPKDGGGGAFYIYLKRSRG